MNNINHMNDLAERYLQNLQAERDELYENLQDSHFAGHCQAIAWRLAELEREIDHYMSGAEGV